MIDQDGLLVGGMNSIVPFQAPFVQDRSVCASWPLEQPGRVTLLDVVHNAKPTTLIGVSGQPGSFSEPVVRAHGRDQPPPGDLPAVESDLARRGDALRHSALERGPRHRRHRQPVSAAGARRAAVQGRSDQQLVHFPGRRPRRHRGAGEPHHRHDVHGGRQGARGDVAGAQRHRAAIFCRRSPRSAKSRLRWRAPWLCRRSRRGSPPTSAKTRSTRRSPPRCGRRGICRTGAAPETGKYREDRHGGPQQASDRSFRRQHSAAGQRDRVPHAVARPPGRT